MGKVGGGVRGGGGGRREVWGCGRCGVWGRERERDRDGVVQKWSRESAKIIRFVLLWILKLMDGMMECGRYGGRRVVWRCVGVCGVGGDTY